MALGPFSTEQVHDSQFEELVGHICLHPGMYVTPATFGGVCAYLGGFDAARSGGPLMGLHPWLVVRAGTGNNLHWSSLARYNVLKAEVDEAQAIEDLGRLLKEFFDYRRSHGLAKIFRDYAHWLIRKPWYMGPLRRDNA